MLWVYGHYKYCIFSMRDRVKTSKSDVSRRKILSFKEGPRAERVNLGCVFSCNLRYIVGFRSLRCIVISTKIRTKKLRYIVGFGLVEMAIATNSKPTIYRSFFENTDQVLLNCFLSFFIYPKLKLIW